MPDGDFLEVFNAPQISVLTHCAQIKAGDPEGAGSNFGIPAIEAAKIEIRFPVRQPTGLDRVQIVDQKHKDIAIRRVERRGVSGDVDVRIVDPRRPVEHTGHLPARVAGAVASDLLHGCDQF